MNIGIIIQVEEYQNGPVVVGDAEDDLRYLLRYVLRGEHPAEEARRRYDEEDDGARFADFEAYFKEAAPRQLFVNVFRKYQSVESRDCAGLSRREDAFEYSDDDYRRRHHRQERAFEGLPLFARVGLRQTRVIFFLREVIGDEHKAAARKYSGDEARYEELAYRGSHRHSEDDHDDAGRYDGRESAAASEQ